MPLPPQTISSLQTLLTTACTDPQTSLPGVAVAVVDKNGNELFAGTGGACGLNSPEPMSVDNVFWIASCTKLIVGIAAMQLVEQGKLALDDAEQLVGICPELGSDLKVLRPDGTLEEKKRGITLRMLLTHTAGFGYSFINPYLRDHSRPAGYDEFSGHFEDFKQPLVNQPGEVWEYGINIDWVGIVIERVTGQSLNAYLKSNIFDPLGLKNISMVPSPEMKSKLAYMHQRDKNGEITVRDHLLQRPLKIDPESESDAKSLFMSGGAGCYSTPGDYAQILATLLNNGVSPLTSNQILSPSTISIIFTNQIPHLPSLTTKHMPSAKPPLIKPTTGLHPTVSGDNQGWGLTFLLSGGTTGRALGTAQWSGLPNLRWWCDRETGVAGIVCAQVLPFGDKRVFELSQGVEELVYGGLKEMAL
ncbi:beta-lactamase/transpeptidase-like protein [Aspergillus karnatakaensis]|uniref:serine hydrolase domain-containing protein n=1 Tax=Aspergillus karnatakaensis TaxID=1810916 RepID=UPI003CCCF825